MVVNKYFMFLMLSSEAYFDKDISHKVTYSLVRGHCIWIGRAIHFATRMGYTRSTETRCKIKFTRPFSCEIGLLIIKDIK
jgi:hypothetical protein